MNQAFGHSMSKGYCQLCKVLELIFKHVPFNHTHLGAHIKKVQFIKLYSLADTWWCFCIFDCDEGHNSYIAICERSILKIKMGKKKSDVETEEADCLICWFWAWFILPLLFCIWFYEICGKVGNIKYVVCFRVEKTCSSS